MNNLPGLLTLLLHQRVLLGEHWQPGLRFVMMMKEVAVVVGRSHLSKQQWES